MNLASFKNVLSTLQNGLNYFLVRDVIELKGLRFKAFHGCFENEKRFGQIFIVDSTFYSSFPKPHITKDDLSNATNYVDLYRDIKETMTKESVNLLETLSDKICCKIFKKHKNIFKIDLSIKKCTAPLNIDHENFDYIGIKIERYYYYYLH